MYKKGQVTVFIILGIFILGIIAGVLYFVQSSKTEDLESASAEVTSTQNSIQFFVESCLQKSAEDCLSLIGKQGGYYYIPPSLRFGFEKIPVLINDNELFFPDIAMITEQYNLCMADIFPPCLDNFSSFQNQGMEFKIEEPVFEVIFTNQSVLINLMMLVQSKIGDQFITNSKFSRQLSSPFLERYNHIKYVFNNLDNRFIPLGALGKNSQPSELGFDVINLEGTIYAYTFYLKDDLLNNNLFVFSFLGNYTFDLGLLGLDESIYLEEGEQ